MAGLQFRSVTHVGSYIPNIAINWHKILTKIAQSSDKYHQKQQLTAYLTLFNAYRSFEVMSL